MTDTPTTINLHAHIDRHSGGYIVNAWDGTEIDRRWLVTPAVEGNVTRVVRDHYGVAPKWTYTDQIMRSEMTAEITTNGVLTMIDFAAATDTQLAILAQALMDHLGSPNLQDEDGTDAMLDAVISEQCRREGITVDSARFRLWV